MSAYSKKGKGWRYDFTLRGIRYTEAWFKTKKEATRAEAQKREEVTQPQQEKTTLTDISFLDLVNLRLDHVKAYHSDRYYNDTRYKARRWIKKWGKLNCSQLSQRIIEKFILERNKVSPYTANMEIRCLRALFNFGKKKKSVKNNPLDGIDFLPVEKRAKYVPPVKDIDKVIAMADPDTQDYLWTIRETMARVNEINCLTWNDVDFSKRTVTLYTRKKKGGNLTPRRISMTTKLFGILDRRYRQRDPDKPWVFWHRYWSRKENNWKEGPYQDRKLLMKNLCKKVAVPYFRYHALRHAGASLLENSNIPIGTIQRILGHENRSTTEIYLHSIGEAERDAMLIYEEARQSHTQSLTQREKGFKVKP